MLRSLVLLSACAAASAFAPTSGFVGTGRLSSAVKARSASAAGPKMQFGNPFGTQPAANRAANNRAPPPMPAPSGMVPDMGRRNMMNALLLGSVAGPILVLPAVLISFLIPAKTGGGGGGIIAKDALGNDVKVADWIAAKGAGDRSLVQGLKGDATYLIVNDDKTLEKFGVNAVCTHLGCVVPWNKSANKFCCPCHGSQYDKNGKVVRGPAPLSLALANRGEADGKVTLSTWTTTDFRTNEKPWWK